MKECKIYIIKIEITENLDWKIKLESLILYKFLES